MRFQGVDLPQAVIEAQRRGELVIFAGAGVSMDAPSNYPNFRDLATELGGAAYPIGEHELIDRYLGRLVEHNIAVHDRVKARLSDPNSHPNNLHEAIVRLFGSAAAIRIVTSNFDDHFGSAAQTVYGSVPDIYRAPALPLGDDFHGIVHIHGSVLNDARKLVLSDADFGRAYLTHGWARRLVQQLFSKFVVLFVGYSHQDLPLLYLARGISAAEGGPGRYALTAPNADTDWLNLGITPVHYPMREAPAAPHSALGDCLTAWAELANLGSLGTEARIKGVVTSDRPLSIEDEDFLKHSLHDIGTLRYFTRHARDTRWLQWISSTESFNAIFVPGAALSESSVELAAWFAEYFAIPHFAIAIELVREKNQTLSPFLWNAVAQAFHRHAASGAPLRLWVPILLGTMPVNAHSDFLAYMIGHGTVPEDQHSILQLFRKLVAPTLRLKRRFFPVEDGKPAVPDAEVVPIGSDHWTSHAYQTRIRPHLDVFAKGLASTVTLTFEEARTMLVMYEKAGPKWDPISYSRGAVASRMQDHLRNGFSTLIDAGADILRWADEHDPKYATSLIGQWIESDAPILRRLAIAGMAGRASVPADEKLSWAISNSIVEDFWLKNETFALLAEAYGNGNDALRAELLAQAETVMTRAGEDHERYEFFNLLSWLHKHAPECALVADKLQIIQERHPEWGVREHPDFNSWIGGGVRVLQPASPTPALEIATMDLDEVVGESARLAEVKDTFGDSMQSGFLQEISRATAANLAWSEGIAREALERTDIPAEIWSALVRGWTGNHTVEEWSLLLAAVSRLEPVFGSMLYELSSLLTAAVEQKEPGLPVVLLDSAFAIANAVQAVCEAQESPLPEEDDNWVTVAINRTSGHLLEFYFDALRLLWPNREQERERIQAILQVLETMIAKDGPAAEIARILVASRAALFADISPDWYAANVLPLLATPANPRSAEQNWDGYLVWGTWTQPMLEGLLPAHLQHLPAIAAASSERSSMFCRNLAGFAVFGVIDPLDSGWLSEFLTCAAHRERVHWAASVTQMLREADEQAKESAWERWIHRYLQRRAASNPLPLHAEEAGDICEWALTLNAHYGEVAELLVAGPAPSVRGNLFYHRLQEANLLDDAPVVTARLLAALLSQEDGRELWDLDQIHVMVARLIELDPTEPALRPLCERLGTIGSPMALEFQSRLR
jgi:hypothetical protein